MPAAAPVRSATAPSPLRAAALDGAGTREGPARGTARAARATAAREGRPEEQKQAQARVSRRTAAVGQALLAAAPWRARRAQAVQLSEQGDAAWQGLGGGPADLVYPAGWAGEWDVVSTLVSVETPMGADAAPDPAEVERARKTELNQPSNYSLRFTRNGRGQVVADRPFNTASMLRPYPGMPEMRYSWNVDDPNVLTLFLPGSRTATSRVTRRYEERDDNARTIATSELFELVFEAPNAGPEGQTRVKKNRCLTKYKWRTDEEAVASAERRGGDPAEEPRIVATQVVSTFLTPFDGLASAERAAAAAKEDPVVVYTYKMAFRPRPKDASVTQEPYMLFSEEVQAERASMRSFAAGS